MLLPFYNGEGTETTGGAGAAARDVQAVEFHV